MLKCLHVLRSPIIREVHPRFRIDQVDATASNGATRQWKHVVPDVLFDIWLLSKKNKSEGMIDAVKHQS